MKVFSIRSMTLTALSFVATTSLFAQNPVANPGFEQWASVSEPVSWETLNIPSGPTPVTQSSTPRSGSFSARSEVVDFFGTPYPGLIIQDNIPVSGTVWSVSGYYHLQGVAGDGMFVSAALAQDTAIVGAGAFASFQNTTGFTAFAFNITEVQPGSQPDHATIFLGNATMDTVTGQYHIGSYVLFDDIAMSPTFTGIEREAQIPLTPALRQNYPNPFNPLTIIEYDVSAQTGVMLKLYDVMGAEIGTLVREEQAPGTYRIPFDGSKLASGVYFYRLSVGSFIAARRMILVK